jgi:hypothetical protein
MPVEHRRSSRLILRVAVTVQGTSPDGTRISEDAHTLVVSAHGALLPMETSIALGQVLVVRHNKSNDEMLCKVARIEKAGSGRSAVGIEFLYPSAHFWQVSSPPVDWLRQTFLEQFW